MRLSAQPGEAAVDGMRHGSCKQLGQALGFLHAQENLPQVPDMETTSGRASAHSNTLPLKPCSGLFFTMSCSYCYTQLLHR